MSGLTIHKYELRFVSDFELRLPAGAQVLSVQMQGQVPCLWALVDPSAPMQTRLALCRGTGHPADGLSAHDHIGTVQYRGVIFHFFLSAEATR